MGCTIGIAAGLVAATIWGATLAVTRIGVEPGSALAVHDLVLLRFGAPALVLLPFALRALPRIGRRQAVALLFMVAGGGAPFLLLLGSALREAEAAEAGALLPGALPLWVAAASLLKGTVQGHGLTPRRGFGLALMALAVALVAGPEALGGGTALLLCAGWLAAAYTLALRHGGLAPLEATALVSLASVIGFLPVYAIMLHPGLGAADWGEIALQLAWQGGASGLVAPIAFASAVARLGAGRASAFAALSPVTAACCGFVLIGETPEGLVTLGLLCATVGVAFATWERRRATEPLRCDA